MCRAGPLQAQSIWSHGSLLSVPQGPDGVGKLLTGSHEESSLPQVYQETQKRYVHTCICMLCVAVCLCLCALCVCPCVFV